MSGVEIAGLVLGAFPVALTALEKYRTVARSLGFWWEIRLEYQKCSSEISYHRVIFSRNLKQLLLPLVADKDQIQRLVADLGGAGWKDPELARQLEDRLQDSYEIYFHIMQQMNEAMNELNKELGGEKTGFQEKVSRLQVSKSWGKRQNTQHVPKTPKVKTSVKANLEYEAYRIKFSVGEPNRKRLFDELQTCNERLEKLLGTSDVMAVLESENVSQQASAAISTMSTTMGRFWRHADRLYSLLSGAWKCNCWGEHCVRMLLQHKTGAEAEFRLLFMFAASRNFSTPTPWSSQDAHIKLLDAILPASESVPIVMTSVTSSPASTPNHRTALPLRPSLGAQRKTSQSQSSTCVSNAEKPTITLTSNLLPQASRNPPPQFTDDDASISKIENLCLSLSNSKPTTPLRGFLEDEDKRCYMSFVPQKVSSPTHREATLDQLLSPQAQPPLSRRQRYSSALILASSFLQLRDSSWLKGCWSKSEICFLRDCDDSNTILLDRPYITRNFSSPASAIHVQNSNSSSFAALGVVLLELCFGTLIENHPARLQYPSGDEQTKSGFDQLAAFEWLKTVGEEAGPDYAGAVDWCLLGSKKVPDGDAWRRELYQHVVQPLDLCHKYLHGNG
ncbi:hypothetical protein BU16DRAFT_507162 [Lophium mytilinum]|uniref:DUF7580 domain-containing protein n=1 Tax=Lophium mytilinum TaxID=390894 RepID=A0A6A6QZQ3_9PEZI|nr:hypothetical protein BU16DRAFT_507162 [Lophium mytilinum]